MQLSNGARIVFQEEHHLPTLHFRVMFKGGPLWEAADKRGATSLLATLLAKDTKTSSAASIAKRIEEVGGAFSGFAGNNSFGFMAETLSSDVDRALDCLSGALLAPAFKKLTFEIEQAAQVAALLQEDDDVVAYTRKLARQKFFGNYPLALGADGDLAGVKSVTTKDLEALYKGVSVAPNLVLAVSGDFKASKLVPKLESLLRKARSGKLPQTASKWKGPSEVGDFVVHKQREQAVVVQAFPGNKVLDSDYYVGEVADELFSGMASRLFERVREEKGLAYFVRSTRITGLDAGMFAFFAGTQPGKENEVLAEIDAEIARVAAGLIEPAELARVQTRLKAGRRQSLQTNGSRAMQAGLNALQGQSVNDWKLYDSRVSAVSIKDLAEFAQTHFPEVATHAARGTAKAITDLDEHSSSTFLPHCSCSWKLAELIFDQRNRHSSERLSLRGRRQSERIQASARAARRNFERVIETGESAAIFSERWPSTDTRSFAPGERL